MVLLSWSVVGISGTLESAIPDVALSARGRTSVEEIDGETKFAGNFERRKKLRPACLVNGDVTLEREVVERL